MKIFVGGLPKDITDSDLLDAFKDFGEVSSAKIVTDKKTGISRSYGFVEMPNREQANRAIQALHEAVVDGQTVSVKAGVEKAAPKKPFLKNRNAAGPGKKFTPNRNGTGSKPGYNATKSTYTGSRPGGYRKRNNNGASPDQGNISGNVQ